MFFAKDLIFEIRKKWFLSLVIFALIIITIWGYSYVMGPFIPNEIVVGIAGNNLQTTFNHRNIWWVYRAGATLAFVIVLIFNYMPIRSKINCNMGYSYVEGEKIFLYGFGLLTFGLVLSKTTFSTGKVGAFCTYIAYLVLLFKILKYDSYSKRELDFALLILFITSLSKLLSGSEFPLMWGFLIVASKGVNFKKIVKTHFGVIGIVLLICISCSLVGIIKDYIHIRGDGIVRHSFGINYPTNFAAYVFFQVLAWLYLVRKRYWLISSIVVLFTMFLLIKYCHARLAYYELGMLLVGYLILIGLENNKPISDNKTNYAFLKLSQLSMFLGFIIIFYLSKTYDSNIAFYSVLDNLLSTRLSLGNYGLDVFGWSFFGQYVPINGVVSKEIYNLKQYFFLDSSYLLFFQSYGAMFLLLFFVVYYCNCRKLRFDRYYLLIVLLLAVNGIIEHHLIELSYNPFALALFANTDSEYD